jgi:hypothetical protein
VGASRYFANKEIENQGYLAIAQACLVMEPGFKPSQCVLLMQKGGQSVAMHLKSLFLPKSNKLLKPLAESVN